jgi:hypothetical protein
MQPELRATAAGRRRMTMTLVFAAVAVLAGVLGPAAGPAQADVHTVVASGEATSYQQEPGRFWFTGMHQQFVVDGNPFVIDGLYGIIELDGASDPLVSSGTLSSATVASLGPETGDYYVSFETSGGTWNRVWSPGLLIAWEATLTVDTTLCHTPLVGSRTCVTTPVNYRFSGNGWDAEHYLSWTGTSPA